MLDLFENYKLATDKIFSTPNTNLKSVINSFDKITTNNLTNNYKGLKITISGRLKGISKAKKLVITQGVLRPQTINNKLDYHSRPIYTKWGTIGLKVLC
jgi:ribosomal protein S3